MREHETVKLWQARLPLIAKVKKSIPGDSLDFLFGRIKVLRMLSFEET